MEGSATHSGHPISPSSPRSSNNSWTQLSLENDSHEKDAQPSTTTNTAPTATPGTGSNIDNTLTQGNERNGTLSLERNETRGSQVGYPAGIKLAISTIAPCFSIFLISLVRTYDYRQFNLTQLS